MVAGMGISSLVPSYCSTGTEKACLGTLVLQERRVLFPRTCFALSIVDASTPVSDKQSCFYASAHAFASRSSHKTAITTQLSHPRGNDDVVTIEGWSTTCKNGNGLRACRRTHRLGRKCEVRRGHAARAGAGHCTLSVAGLQRICPQTKTNKRKSM